MLSNRIILSICIPTFNGMPGIINCLKSIEKCFSSVKNSIQICISDNCSSDDSYEQIVKFSHQSKFLFLFNRFDSNQGFDKNVLKVLEMSTGKFAWLCGDDEFFLKNGTLMFYDYLIKLKNNHENFVFNTGAISYPKEKKYRTKIVEKDLYFLKKKKY